MKDECIGAMVEEFVGLRSKMYSLLYDIKNELGHTMYRECLLEGKRKRAILNESD